MTEHCLLLFDFCSIYVFMVWIIHWLYLFVSSSLCLFTFILKFHACEDTNIHLVVFKCVFKRPPQEGAWSHWLHLFDFSSLCVFKGLLISPGWEDALHIHNGYINLIRLRCVFLDGPSKGLPWKIHCPIGCICFGFLLCALSNVSSNRLP